MSQNDVSKMLEEHMSSLNLKLNIIVNLLLRREDLNIREKVSLMDGLNVPNKQAAQVIGISENHYKKEKSLLKNKSPTGAELRGI